MTVKSNLFLLCVSILTVSSAQGTESLTIGTALEQAFSNNVTLQNAKEKLNELDANVAQAWATVFPVISVSGSAAYRKDAVNIGNPLFGGEPYNSYNVGLSIVQPVYTGGNVAGTLGFAKKEEEIRKFDIAMTERDLAFRVLQSFYGVLLAESQVQAMQEQQAVLADFLKTAESRFSRGLSQRLEVLQVRTTSALLVPKIAAARNQIQVAAAELANLMGRSEAREVQVVGSLDGLSVEKMKAFMAGDVGRIPELDKNRSQQEQLDNRKQIQLAKHYPQVNLVGSWGRSSFVKADLLDEFSTSWNTGIQVQIPLFSGGSSFAERRAFASQGTQLELERSRLRDQFSLEQIKARKEVELTQSQIETTGIALNFATESLKEARKTYSLGTTTYTQLFDSEQRYVDAVFSYDKARHDSIIALAKYFNAVGRPLPDLIRLLNEATQANPAGKPSN